MAIRARRPFSAGRPRRKDGDEDLGIPGYVGAELLGQGGFGTVYKARQAAFNRSVAIKVLAAPTLSDETKARFERECLAIGSLSGHPHIVTVYDSGITKSGRAYIAMDYLPGGSFADRLRARGPLTPEEAIVVGIKIAGAIETAHRAGVLHRDIKPENVLLSDYGEPKLADFGVSTVPGAYQTATPSITGSVAHAAPEILSGQRATELSDVYSLASTLFQLVDGRPPFVRADDELLPATIARILRDPPPDLRVVVGLPEAVWIELEKALAKDPSARHGSAEEFGTRLQAALVASGREAPAIVVPAPPIPNIPPPAPGSVPPASRTADLTLRRVAMPRAARAEMVGAEPRRPSRRRLAIAASTAALLVIGAAGAFVATREPPVEPAVARTPPDFRAEETQLLNRAALARAAAAEQRRDRRAELRRKRQAELRRKRARLARQRERERRAAAAAAAQEEPAYVPPQPAPQEPPPEEKPPSNEQPPPN